MTATVEMLQKARALSPLDAHFARAMGRIAGEAREEVLLAAAMVSQHVSRGDVCLDLAQLAGMPALLDDDGRVVAEKPWPDLAAWTETLRSSPLVGGGGAISPLVLDPAGRLYLRRYWEHESELAESLRERATHTESSLDGPWLRATLDRLFSNDGASEQPDGARDWQRFAALLALQRRLCVISGGPGTGKTHTVVKILALLIEQAFHQSTRVPRITLVAPTGKAAARLSESIRKAKGTLSCSREVVAAIPEDAATIHRCLGSIAGSGTSFRHHADNPLVTNVVLVDEASMVDLALMRRLVAAVPPRARLILLGDKDQLASVEAGAVLGDICNTGVARSYSRALAATVAALTGDRLSLGAAAPPGTGIWDCMVELTRSYRYGPDSGIGGLARAINAGDATEALAVLDSGECPEVRLVEPSESFGLSDALRSSAEIGFGAYLQAREPVDQLRALERFRILCAHRRGPTGVDDVNTQVEQALAQAGLIRTDSTTYVGRPIMVTRNDYQLNLFNGDVGLIAPDPEQADRKLALFPGEQGQLRRLSPSRLPPHETVYAMSVHKSQGSEFDEVAVVLPRKPSPVLSRELLYTAVTRARRAVTIHGSREVFAHAVTRRIERASGLREALWQTVRA